MIQEKIKAIIKLSESLREHQFSKTVAAISTQILETLLNQESNYFNPRIIPYLNKINKNGVPYTNYDLDPDNISQIKKLVNALYHAHLALEDLETINLKKNGITTKNLQLIYSNTIHHSYRALYLLTHLDVDVKDMFSEELQMILPMFGKLMQFINSHSDETKEFTARLQTYPISYKAGEITGIAVDQMQPSSADLDYKFLTRFSSILPSYIEQLTQYVKKYSSVIVEKEPTLNNAQLAELRTAALKLLNDLENLKGNGLFLSFKVLNYIHIMRNIITLSMSSVEQMGHFSESSQDVIRDNLAQLKYHVLPEFFGLVDKIEDHTMLKPGTLSNPLMEQVKTLYALLIHYASKPVNFQEKGEELLSIEDSRFLSLRLEQTYERINAANKAIFKIEKAEQALANFYELLENPLYQELAIHQLPQEVKEQLITHYKLIRPYMMQVDFDLNDKMIDSLHGPETYSSWIAKPWRWLTSKLPADHLSFVLEKKHPLQTLISKKRATQEFHINLNMDLRNSVNKQTNLVLFPYSDQTNIFTIDESSALNPGYSCALFSLSNTYTLKPVTKIKYSARTLYLEALTNGLRYEVMSLKGTIETALIPWDKLNDVPHDVKAIIASKENHLPKLLELISNAGHISATAKLTLKEKEPHEPQTLYLETTTEGLKYEVINLQGKLETAVIPWKKLPKFPHDVSELIAAKSKYLPTILEFTSAAGQTLSSTDLKFDEVKPLLKERSAVILLNNKDLVYIDAINKKVTPIKPTEDNQDDFEQLKTRISSTYKVAATTELKQIKTLTGHSLLGYKQVKGQNVLSNPGDLTADQAMDLEQWYRNKRDKFMAAKEAYEEFIELLKKQTAPPGKTEGSVLHLNRLDKTIKAHCRNLYNLFQPYFINGIPAELRTAALEFDKYLVHSFANENVHPAAPAVDMFEQLNEHFQIYFTKIDLSWGRKSRLYAKWAQEKFTTENEAALLEHDATIRKRGHYVIQHTNYSKSIRRFRTDLMQTISIFNKAMQADLKPQSSGIPYPDLEDPNKLLAQNKQVIAIKRIFNGLFHAEGVMIDLEKLNNKSTETRYVYHLARAYAHIDEIINLTKDLAVDPHFNLVARELLEKAQTLYATIQEHIEPYQVAPDEVNYKHTIKFNGLWYTLNAFHISPKHIRSLRNNNFLTIEELNELHISAKRSAAHIESIIDSAGDYFKLFLQVPNMISLYSNLTSKLNEFLSTTHDTIINNLDQFNPKIFTPMLLEADHWEDKLGLKPGSISGPMKKIIDEYFKGLLHPLDMHAKTHTDLICDKTPLNKRIQATNRKIANAERHLDKLEKNYKHVNELFKLITTYENFTRGYVPAPDEIIRATEADMVRAYTKALPKLVWLQKRITFEPDESKNSVFYDDFLNPSLKEYQPKLSQIKSLVFASHSYYLGVKATYQMQLDTAKEKCDYLDELDKAQDIANLKYIEQYTEESFTRQMEAFCNRHIGLQYTDKEYRNKLREYLLSYKARITNEAKTTADINLSVKNLLKEKIKLFEENHFVNYFHLDAVRVALAQFKNYFSISTLAIERGYSLFENEKTLGDKTEKINQLLEFAENEELTVEERFSQIKLDVEDPSFGRIILAHRQADHFSFTYLIHCVLYLLETVYLYTPTRKKLYNDLEKAVNTKPQINELTKRFGLFAKPNTIPTQPATELDTTEEEQENSIATPSVS